MDDEKGSKIWKCDLTCRTFDSEDRQIIIDLKNEFCDDSIENVRDVLQTVDDGCDQAITVSFRIVLLTRKRRLLMNHLASIHLRKRRVTPFHVHRTVALVDCVY